MLVASVRVMVQHASVPKSFGFGGSDSVSVGVGVTVGVPQSGVQHVVVPGSTGSALAVGMAETTEVVMVTATLDADGTAYRNARSVSGRSDVGVICRCR